MNEKLKKLIKKAGGEGRMGDRGGIWAMVYLLIALLATWFIIICIAVWHIKEWLI